VRPISLHHLVALEVDAAELVRIAAETVCDHVCVFTQDPGTPVKRFPVVQEGEVRELARVMDDCGVSAYGVTSFGLGADVELGSFAAGLDRGQQLGATVASVRMTDPDLDRSSDRFAELCDMAAARGLRACIEYSGFSPANTLDLAVRLVAAAGRPNGGITLDALHVVRTHTTMAALRALDPAIVGYAQLCDGRRDATAAEYEHEAASDRLPPGQGEFPLSEILAVVPAGQPVSLEVPMDQLRSRGLAAAARARLVVDAARTLLARQPDTEAVEPGHDP
jgi:sugar phosphate isomerase/epimerase